MVMGENLVIQDCPPEIAYLVCNKFPTCKFYAKAGWLTAPPWEELDWLQIKFYLESLVAENTMPENNQRLELIIHEVSDSMSQY
jgi:hypothetical protein